ncbi:MAG: 3-dehydroquinate synthase [Planctomycetes bacterium]|jgi:3-dehydroquinate synthase|nr:3-dehydroquinate synthase [Planctomycetota bacterium]
MDLRFEFVRRQTSRVVIGRGTTTQLRQALDEAKLRAVVVVHDEALAGLAARVAIALGGAPTLPVPGTEALKDLRHVETAVAALRQLGADRGTALLGLGGGSVTDFTGFLASIWLRGVPFVACPTTTLALCDAALGGKNGIDLAGRKNELGTIRQPELIVGDVDWLETLPDALYREGFVEVLKKAAVLDGERFAELERLLPALRARDASAAEAAITMAVAMKMAVVVADETERDRRRWLNFGHTIGHALESLAAGALRHGECVALGMLAECRAAGPSVPAVVMQRLAAALRAIGAPTEIPRSFARVDELWALAQLDKKVRDGLVPMIVPAELGRGVEVALTRDALALALR